MIPSTKGNNQMKRQLTEAAQAAKMIRKELKKHGIKAKVKSENYSMGSSVNITLNNELPKTVELVTSFAKAFQYGHFDGMNDIYEHSNNNDDLPQAKFVFVENAYSDELKQSVWDLVHVKLQGMDYYNADFKQVTEYDPNHHVSMVLNGTDDFVGFWASMKPRQAA